MRLTTIVRQRAADAAFGAFDDVEAGEDDHKLSVTVSERRTRALVAEARAGSGDGERRGGVEGYRHLNSEAPTDRHKYTLERAGARVAEGG